MMTTIVEGLKGSLPRSSCIKTYAILHAVITMIVHAGIPVWGAGVRTDDQHVISLVENL